jgi:uncharacterized sulfatase
MQRAKKQGKSVYETVRSYPETEFSEILQVAQLSGKISDCEELVPVLQAKDDAVRYWGLVAADGFSGSLDSVKPLLENLLQDESKSVAAIMAAEILVKRYEDPLALQAFEDFLKSADEPLALQAAISLRRTGKKATPLLPVIENEIMPIYAGDVWGRYKNWSYPMFIGMALDQTLINCGKKVKIR